MTANCSDEIPLAEDFFTAVSVAELVCIILSGVLSLVTLSFFIVTTLCLRKDNGTSKSIFVRSTAMIGLYPAMSIFAFLAVCFPKAFLVCILCSSICVSIVTYNFMALLLDIFGGRQELLRQASNNKIRLCFAPFWCCCIPPFNITSKVLKTAQVLVGQTAILQVIVPFFSLVLWLDDKYTIAEVSADNAFPYMAVIKVISTILGMGGIRLMVRICISINDTLDIASKGRVLIIALILHNVQASVFNILASNDIPECSRELSSGVKARAWGNMILIIEMFLLAVRARCLYHQPHRNDYTPSENKGYSCERPTIAETSFEASEL